MIQLIFRDNSERFSGPIVDARIANVKENLATIFDQTEFPNNEETNLNYANKLEPNSFLVFNPCWGHYGQMCVININQLHN